MNQTLKQMPGAVFVVAAFSACAWAAAGPVAGLLAALAVTAVLVWQHANSLERLRPAPTYRRGLERSRINP
jgi:O-antigen/teichoic acid export membrane protein